MLYRGEGFCVIDSPLLRGGPFRAGWLWYEVFDCLQSNFVDFRESDKVVVTPMLQIVWKHGKVHYTIARARTQL